MSEGARIRRLGDLFATGAGESRTGFLGLPLVEDLASVDAVAAVLGVPIATPYPALGTYAAGGPAAIRAGLADFAHARAHHDFDLGGPPLGEEDVRVVDCGDLPGDPDDTKTNRDRIEAAVGALLARGAVPLILGGDDSVPIPFFRAYAGRGAFTVLQIDAHIDWRDEVQGERFGLSSTMRRASEMGWVERIVQVGARGLGSARPPDVADAKAWGAHIITASTFHERGIAPVLDLIPSGGEVLISIDCDGLDPSIMPAVIGPAPGGLGYWDVIGLLNGVAAEARIAGFDIVELMPARDPHGLAALVAARLLCNAIGLVARAARPRG
jgi:agmatinase